MMLNWSWNGASLAIKEAPCTRGSLSLRGFMFAASRRRRWERVDGAARDAIDAARATTRDAIDAGRK